ncbi:MAG: methyl-accepting chemotaxis protein [Aliishimia sp.]
MTTHDPTLHPNAIGNLAVAADQIGFEIVDISGFFDLVEMQAKGQMDALKQLNSSASTVEAATAKVRKASTELSSAASQTRGSVKQTVDRVRSSSENAQHMASWVSELSDRTVTVSDTLKATKTNNQQIVSIARQVNILAINAKIEAARAGEAGRGFSVVADAINELSQKTGNAAVEISQNIETLTSWIMNLSEEAQNIADKATTILENSELNNQSLSEMQSATAASHKQSEDIAREVETMRSALETFAPSLSGIENAVSSTTDGIETAHARLNKLIDTSEQVVQSVASIGGASADSRFFTFVQSAAKQISELFDAAIASGEISAAQMFDETYTPISGTNPEQVKTAFTDLTDKLLPAIQEPALDFDERVVFCAAVDKNGYLPTHNLKFSQPQSDDPVWNTGNCRNRRIFDDRVGMKAGTSTSPFLCQVYRRDMGGGNFTMMKDVSAPIYVGGRHWGGLRFAVTL